jgi:hypothetical protein
MRTSGTARILARLLVGLRVVAVIIALAVLVQVLRGEPLALDRLFSSPPSIGSVITTSATDQEQSGPLGRRELRFKLQELVAHDTMLAIRFMRSTIADDPAFVDAANAVLVRSADDVELALARALPAEDASAFADGWAEYTQGLFAYATALRDDDDAAREQAREQLTASAAEQATLLSEITDGSIEEDVAATSLEMRGDLLLYQLDAYAGEDYDQAYELAHEAYGHSAAFAATLAAGATGHDPHAVDVSAKEELRAELARVLGEHVELSTDTLRAGVTGSDDFSAAAGALDGNTRELSDIMASALGGKRARKPIKLWSEHVDQLLRYAIAVADQDAATRRELRDGLRATSERIGRQLEKATDHEINAIAVTEALRSQQLLQLDQIDAYARGDYASAHDTASTAHHRAAGLAKTLASGFMTIVRTRMPQGGADTGGGGTASTP